MFHIYQSLYDPRGYWRRQTGGSWLWMLDAASTWFEKKMVSRSNYLSPNAKAFDDFLYLHGLEYAPGDKTEVQRHGYGASLFLDYMTAQKDDKLIGELFKAREPKTGYFSPDSLYSPVDALLQQEFFLGYKWQVFVKQLAEGMVNPDISFLDLISPPHAKLETYTNSADTDTGTKFQWAAPDLSARGYTVTFPARATQWDTGTKLTFLFTGPANDAVAYLYRFIAGKGWVYQADVKSTYEVANAEQLAKDGARFFFLVANGHAERPFTGTTPITLEVRIDAKTGGYPVGLGQAEISLVMNADLVTFVCTDGTNTTTKKGQFNADYYTDLRNYPGLTWKGRNFSLDATTQANGNADTYTLKFDGQVDATGANIVTWSVDYAEAHVSTTGRKDTHIQFTAQDIPHAGPLFPSSAYGWNYLLNGSMSGHLTGLRHSVITTYVESLKTPPQSCTGTVSASDLASPSWKLWTQFGPN
jgi:hypothetical protein